jgi:hypothetical protein
MHSDAAQRDALAQWAFLCLFWKGVMVMVHPQHSIFLSGRKAPAVENFAWLPLGVISAKPARGYVSLI